MISKTQLRKKFWKDSQKYYPTNYLKNRDFKRYICKKCGKPFWSIKKRDYCGDVECNGSYSFIGKSLTKRKLSYVDTWKEFVKIFSEFGYTEIPRYPVVARWRPDTWFTQASIYCFQPYVVSGEINPPANPLVIPQPSLRFNDVENVGITGAHYTTHVHIGQHAFKRPEHYKPETYLEQIHTWLNKGLTLEDKEIVFHEDVWVGGGNFGPCLEFFAGGLELGNQVYMQYKETSKGSQKLNMQVLDMGAGLERNAWIMHGTPTSYDVAFEPLDNKYRKKLGINSNKKILKDFSKYGGLINVDEPMSISKAWKTISKKLNVSEQKIQKEIEPLRALYSILDHSRTLLFALGDGALPSNSGGGYNLRFILRRALRFIEQYNWDISLNNLVIEHSEILKSIYPELKEKIASVEKILYVEQKKHNESKQNIMSYLAKIKNKPLSEDQILKLYDSRGILPEQLIDINPKIKIPLNFSTKISELHEKKEKVFVSDSGLDLSKLPPTEILYLPSNEKQNEFSAKILKIFDKRFVVLDKTLFYAESGGQVSDEGTLNNCKVISVEKYGKHVIHELEECPFKKGEVVIGNINYSNRLDLMRNHTAIHIINGAARSVLGEHIWQAGSSVDRNKARLDITHWDNLTDEELQEIEEKANNIILKNIKLNKEFLSKDEAEKKYGFRLYQGGAVPGSELRIIAIKNFDVEACGGTHVFRTGDLGIIKILKSKKLQDGVIRLEFTSGKPALKEIQHMEKYFNKACEVFRVQPENLSSTCDRFFAEWKKQKKELKKVKKSGGKKE